MHCPATATQPLESAHVVALRQEVGDLLVQSCIDFINEPVNRLILGFAVTEALGIFSLLVALLLLFVV